MRLKVPLILSLALLMPAFASAQNRAPAPRATATAHQTVLAWTASATTPVSYSVYKCTTQPCPAPSTAAAPGAPYSSIASGVTALTFTDTAVTTGQTATYTVTATCTATGAAGCGTIANPITGESVGSNVVNATTPNNPVAPQPPVLSITSAN